MSSSFPCTVRTSPTSVSGHNSRAHNHGLIASDVTVGTIYRLDRPRQKFEWLCVITRRRCDGSRLKGCTPGVAQGQRTISWRISSTDLLPEGRVRKVEAVSELLQYLCIPRFNGTDGASRNGISIDRMSGAANLKVPVSSNPVVHDGPGRFGQRVGLDTTSDEVNSLCCPNE